jgi:hypothetical protein
MRRWLLNTLTFLVAVVLTVVLGVALVRSAHATEKPATQSQSQITNANQANAQTVNAAGGQGGGASNQLSIGGDRSTAVALAHGAPIPAQCPAGLVPGKRGKRGLVAGLVALSAVCVPPTAEEAAAMQIARDHELALGRLAVDAARAEAERDRAASARISAEACRTSCVSK